MKAIRNWLLLIVSSLFLFSCSNESEDSGIQSRKVRLQGVLNETGITKVNQAWDGSEKIGVYMIENDGFTVVDGVDNRPFNISAGAGSTLIPADENDPFYPTDGRDVKFVAYHPYNASIEAHSYPVDLTDSDIADHDLLYARTESGYNQTQLEAVPLVFVHQLSKLIIKPMIEQKNDNGEIVKTSLTEAWTATINGSTKAEFDLTTGVLGSPLSAGKFEMQVNQATAESVILPGKLTGVTVVYDNKTYEWNTAALNFAAGVQYTYTLTLKLSPEELPDPISATLVSSIKDWDKETGEADLEEKPAGEPDLPVEDFNIYTSNVDLAQFSLSGSAYLGNVSIHDVLYPAIKMGSSTTKGSAASMPIGDAKTTLSLYAVSWKDQKGALKITVKNGGTINGNASVTINPMSNAGAAGLGGTNAIYTMTVADSDLYSFTLAGITATSTLLFETLDTADKRAIIFGVNVK